MKRIDFNSGWTCRPLSRPGDAVPVTLPHDAMRTENRVPDSIGEGNIGFFEGGDYEYRKVFTFPEEAKGQHLELEFEGVYHDPEITVNGKQVDAPPYGYTNFAINLTDLVQEGENEISIIAHNDDQPNSRWYSGTGIYRPVWLWMGGESRILRDGIRVTTLSIAPKRIRVEVSVCGEGTVDIGVWDKDKNLAHTSAVAGNGKAECEITLQNAELWSPEHPKLYTLRAAFGAWRTSSVPERSAQTASWSMAAARNVSAAATSTRLPSFLNWWHSFPIVVVLPAPLTPITRMTEGLVERSSPSSSPIISEVIS